MRLVLDGEAERLRMQHDMLAKFIWHAAFMTAYAPTKPKDFWKLKTLLWRAPHQERKPTNWKDKFAAMSAWAASFKKG